MTANVLIVGHSSISEVASLVDDGNITNILRKLHSKGLDLKLTLSKVVAMDVDFEHEATNLKLFTAPVHSPPARSENTH